MKTAFLASFLCLVPLALLADNLTTTEGKIYYDIGMRWGAHRQFNVET